jgi:hypothetical protein
VARVPRRRRCRDRDCEDTMSETTKQRSRAAHDDNPKTGHGEDPRRGYLFSERLLLVWLGDGSCLWLLNAHAQRSGGTIRVRTESGVEIVVPAAGTDLMTYEAGARRPSSVVRLEEIIDEVRFALDEKLWWTLDERRRTAHPAPSADGDRRRRLSAQRARKSRPRK